MRLCLHLRDALLHQHNCRPYNLNTLKLTRRTVKETADIVVLKGLMELLPRDPAIPVLIEDANCGEVEGFVQGVRRNCRY